MQYQRGAFASKLLYASWQLSGDAASEAGKDVQQGGYLEASYKPVEAWGLFVRQSNWTQEKGVDKAQTNFGASYFPLSQIVFKLDYQLQNQDAGNADGFYLGMGYEF